MDQLTGMPISEQQAGDPVSNNVEDEDLNSYIQGWPPQARYGTCMLIVTHMGMYTCPHTHVHQT